MLCIITKKNEAYAPSRIKRLQPYASAAVVRKFRGSISNVMPRE
jgi:hypothetical protein